MHSGASSTRLGFLVAGLLVFACSGCRGNETPAPASTRQPDRPVLLGTAVRDGSADRIEVGLGTCASNECPIEVRLIRDRKTINVLRSGWPAPDAGTTRVEPTAVMGVGDTPAGREQPLVWASGEEERTVITAARSVTLRDGRNAIVIDQMSGFEHPKRRHEIVAASGGTLVSLWSYVEPQGPYWSSVLVRQEPDGGDELMLLIGFSPDPAQPDELSLQRLMLSADGSALGTAALPPTGEVAVLGPFATVKAARAAKAQNLDCLASFSVFPARRLGVERVGGFVLGAVAAERRKANQVLTQGSACLPDAMLRTVESTTLRQGS